jgi:hypothetical protein
MIVVACMLIPGTLANAQEENRGYQLYLQYCASCHGENGRGMGPVSPYLTVKPTDLTHITARRSGEFPREQLKRIIAGEELPPGHGTRTMPVWGERLQDDLIGGANKTAIAGGRISFLVDYLSSIQDTGGKEFENILVPGPRPAPGPGTIR